MENTPYNLHNLRQLMAESAAYQSLSAEDKANIEEHIRLNNRPVLMYVFHHLSKERQSLEVSREKLAKKVLTPNPAALHDLRNQLKTGIIMPHPDSLSGQNLL